ncbi:M48 family metallopeptidase [Calothrix sp. FACHB-1219]|uniref:M48 family metallopeptidase n=1 Tax=unclassified Calothrix TaxID=2619626 RepID=UPI001685E78B|nr:MULTISPECIES: M48 family metallopeptidase [unclassified Calothrix]MBD2206135.1 M48 family metallopeptidase [Calothrix sp. FACHB-168]MBD2220906.1 M48 family metallopeptidase [Calothrix sp. FACHB-1219]
MNFFEHQDIARQNTQKLIGLFALSIAVMIVAIYIAMLFVLRMAPRIWWHSGLFFWVATITIIAIALASTYKIFCLREGGSMIAQQLGGRLLIPEMADEQGRQLLNIVEEMAIASGISVPTVYLLESESGINAFAAGFTPNDAVIGVTRGSLQHLNRDELQGVIGHEFSHILNGDMRLNLRLMGLLHGILFIYLAGEFLWRWRVRGSSEEKGLPLWAFGLALMAIGSIGLLCGRLIKAAVSRQREFLADASAVQFTRNPVGITGVFVKLQQMDSRLIAPGAEAASHMFFGNALKLEFWEDMFATHPPLTERIRRIGSLNPQDLAKMRSPMRHQSHGDGLAMGFAGGGNHTAITPEQIVNQVGSVAPEHFAHAQALLAQLPESLRMGVKEQQSATAIAFALALEPDNPEIQERQITWLKQVQPPELIEKTLEFSSEISQLDPSLRLPLVDLMIPTFRQTSAKECQRLCKCVQGIIIARGSLSLWNFVLQLVLWHRLEPCINPTAHTTVEFTSIDQIWSDSILVLSALARVGQTQPDEIAYAFRSGVFRLPGAGQQQIPDTPVNGSFTDIKKSIDRLRLATPKLKQALVDACAHTVLLDNKVTPSEADLLRAIAMTLDCPIPPFLNSQRGFKGVGARG